MRFLTRRPHDWQIVQQARADFIINRIREHLPSSTLWHEKRYALNQLESLVIVSTGGLYSVDTFDSTGDNLLALDDFAVFDDLAMRVRHDSQTHKTLDDQDIQRIIHAANSEFDLILIDDRQFVTSAFNRVTCTVDFHSPTDDVEHSGKVLLDIVADRPGYPLSHVPFITKEIWLPTSDFYNAKQLPEYARSAGEFVFDQPLPVDQVAQRIQAAAQSTRSLRAPGIHGTIPGIQNIHDVHFVGRRF